MLKNKELFRALDLNLKRKAMDYKDRTINLLANRKNQDSFESDRVVFRQLNDTR